MMFMLQQIRQVILLGYSLGLDDIRMCCKAWRSFKIGIYNKNNVVRIIFYLK